MKIRRLLLTLASLTAAPLLLLSQAQETPAPEPSKETTPTQAPAPVAEPKPATETPAPQTVKTPPIPTVIVQGDYSGKVVVIPVGQQDLINPARFDFMSRTLKRASSEGAEAIIFDLDTPGGIAWNTTTVMMQDLQKLTTRSIAFVNPRAVSAGALIAVATDEIYMSPASSIGAATPVNSMGQEMGDDERAKMNAAFMGMARSAAKAKGHNANIVDSMIDKDIGLKIGDIEIVAKGQICMLDQEQATKMYDGKPLLAKAVAKDIDEVRKLAGLKGELITAEPKGFERVAIWITQYAAILLMIGVAAGYLEMQHPGFGLPGIIAIAAFATFFFGHYVAGSLIGHEVLFCFMLGVILLAVEIFVFPGVVIPGALGLVLILGSLIYTMSSWDITVPEGEIFAKSLSAYLRPLVQLSIAFLGAIGIIALLMRFLPDVGPFSKMVLQTEVGGAQGAIEGAGQSRASALPIGAEGITRSSLRPYGNIEVDGVNVEATVEGDYLPPGTPIRVRSITGGRVVVEKV